MKTFRNLICLALVAVIASVGVADEKEKKGKGKRQRKGPSVTQRFVGKLELSDEQKAKVAAVDKQFAEKAKELVAKRNAILTPEQRKAKADAQKAARAAKAAGKDAPDRKALNAALNLTEDQKKQQKDLTGAQQELNKEVIAALKKILTADQIAKLPKAAGGRKAGAQKKKGDGTKKKPDGAAKGEKGKKKDAE